jgi:UrcA family protein
MSKIVTRIASAAAIALAAVPVLAAGAAHAESRRVVVSDIDFGRAEDVARFDARIHRVAWDLCPLAARQNTAKAEACRQQIRTRAVAMLGVEQRQKLAMVDAAAFNLAAK